MPKKIPIQQKRDWLIEYEKNGKSIDKIAEDNHRGVQTVKKALEDAQRDRDMQSARAELMKDALYKHQARLGEGLRAIVKQLDIPNDFTPLSWYEGEESIFDPIVDIKTVTGIPGISLKKGRPYKSVTNTNDMLRQHLKGDTMWKLLVQWEKELLSHVNDRLMLQKKLVSLLKEKTGYPMVGKDQVNPPFLVSYTLGPFLYESAILVANGDTKKRTIDDEIIVDIQSGTVKYRHSILAEAPGNEETCRTNIIESYKELLKSTEFTDLNNSSYRMYEISKKSMQAYEEFTFLEYIPGSCNVCKKLGM